MTNSQESSSRLQEVKGLIEDKFKDEGINFMDSIYNKDKFHSHISFEINVDAISDCMSYLRDHLKIEMLVDICGVDYPAKQSRFEVVYQLLDIRTNIRITAKVSVPAKTAKVATVSNIYKSAAWFEREVYDMFGIEFTGHKDLRRILTDYNFKHFPLRKDFPLTGYEEIRYDYEKEKIITEDVDLPQDFRNLNSQSPWEGAIDREDEMQPEKNSEEPK